MSYWFTERNYDFLVGKVEIRNCWPWCSGRNTCRSITESIILPVGTRVIAEKIGGAVDGDRSWENYSRPIYFILNSAGVAKLTHLGSVLVGNVAAANIKNQPSLKFSLKHPKTRFTKRKGKAV
jgi:hypothetical protein